MTDPLLCLSCSPPQEFSSAAWTTHAAVEHGLDLREIREAEVEETT